MGPLCTAREGKEDKWDLKSRAVLHPLAGPHLLYDLQQVSWLPVSQFAYLPNRNEASSACFKGLPRGSLR